MAITPARAWRHRREIRRLLEALPFWDQVDTSAGPRGCWHWTGPQNGGYPRFGGELVHRLVVEAVTGMALGLLTVDHVCHTCDLRCPGGLACRHRLCVNPAHLEPVTLGENIDRMWQRLKKIAKLRKSRFGWLLVRLATRPIPPVIWIGAGALVVVGGTVLVVVVRRRRKATETPELAEVPENATIEQVEPAAAVA